MAIKLSNPKDFASGMMFLGVGLTFALIAWFAYPMGKGARMGPGYFPFWVGVLLTVLGAVIAVNSLRTTGEAIGRWALRQMFWVILAIVLFGVLLRPLGMIGSGAVLLLLASIPSGAFKWKEVLLLTAALLLMCALIFVYGLKLPIPLWPSFLG